MSYHLAVAYGRLHKINTMTLEERWEYFPIRAVVREDTRHDDTDAYKFNEHLVRADGLSSYDHELSNIRQIEIGRENICVEKGGIRYRNRRAAERNPNSYRDYGLSNDREIYDWHRSQEYLRGRELASQRSRAYEVYGRDAISSDDYRRLFVEHDEGTYTNRSSHSRVRSAMDQEAEWDRLTSLYTSSGNEEPEEEATPRRSLIGRALRRLWRNISED